MDVAAGVLGESIARTWSCRADFHHLLLCCCAQHLLASLCRHPTTGTGHSWPLLCCLFPHKCWKIDGRRVWLELSPKIFIYCVEEYFLTCPCSTEGSLQHRIPCINHITVAFLRDAPEYLSRGCSLLIKVGGFPRASIAPCCSLGTASPTGRDPGQLPSSLLHHPSTFLMRKNSFGNGEADRGFSHLYFHMVVLTQLYFLTPKNTQQEGMPFMRGQEHER